MSGAPAVLRQPAGGADGQVLMYGLGYVLQVAPRKAAVLCNVRTVGSGHWDFEDGTDAIVFDSLATITRRKAVVVARNTQDVDPETGRPRVAVHYPIVGGFVPLGARRTDGSPHPHAGTGFGLSEILRFDLNDQGFFTWNQPYTRQWRLYQFTYDGRRFRVPQADVSAHGVPLGAAGGVWSVTGPGMSTAIPDGDGLLYAAAATDGSRSVSGVSRWERRSAEWRPVAFCGISDGSEASLTRDMDGSLLYSVRGEGDWTTAVRVWRSPDGAKTWEQVLSAPGLRSGAPVVLNQAANGTPYVAADQLGSIRAKLCLWPLTGDRRAVEPAIVARDAAAGFGPPPNDTTWFVDHATATTVRLADGHWHNLLAYRVMAYSTVGVGGETVTPHTGCYVEELLSPGKPVPTWRFE